MIDVPSEKSSPAAQRTRYRRETNTAPVGARTRRQRRRHAAAATKKMNDPAKLLLGETPPAPTPARLLTRQPGALGSWGHLLPLSERQLASATLRCLRNAMPRSVIIRVLQYAIVDDETLETTLALVDRAIRNEVPVQEKGPPTGARPCQSRWWNQYRRAVVDSLHGLAERCELELVVAHHAANLGVPRYCGAFTPSTRLVSIRRGRGWFLF